MGDFEEAPSCSLQLVLLAGEQWRVVDLPSAGTLTLGRADDCALRIEDPSVSRHHACLHIGTELVIEDLASVNGTLIRERSHSDPKVETLGFRRLQARRSALAVGDTLLLGSAHVVVRRRPASLVPKLGRLGDATHLAPALRAVYAQAALAASTPISVLLLGETGVGKEVLARAIHASSPRARHPFQAINCATLSETLLESELFGHEKGAFTGAHQCRAGLLEAAAGGTVLLDEIGELAPVLQAKLLRVLDEHAVTRLGSSRPRPIDVRFLAATHRDLEAACGSGMFRADLFFRLNGLSLAIPPLRERLEELEGLARGFLAAACRAMERFEALELHPQTLERLHAHAWPGNVRELKNAMDRAAALCPGRTVLPEHLPPSLGTARPVLGTGRASNASAPARVLAGVDFGQLPTELRALERTRIVEALERSGGVQTVAARALGISRRTLIARIEEYGLPRPRKGERQEAS